MAVPPKRKSNRAQRRANQRTGAAADPHQESSMSDAQSPNAGPTGGAWVAAPPRTCAPHHFYWCDGHNDWHHHTEEVIDAIEASFAE